MVSWIYDAYKDISKNFTLIVDTREHRTERFRRRMEAFEELGVHPLRQKLDVGDYSAIVKLPKGEIIDFTERIVLERKANLSELTLGLGTNHKNLEAELLRAKDTGCRLYIVTEGGSYDDMINGNYKNGLTPTRARAIYHTFEQRYGVHIVFVKPDSFPVFVYETLRRYIMDYLRKTYPNGEIL